MLPLHQKPKLRSATFARRVSTLEFPDLTYQVVGVLQYTTSLLKYSFFALPMHFYTEPGWTRSGFQYADVEGYFNAIPTKSILPNVQFQSHASLAGSTIL